MNLPNDKELRELFLDWKNNFLTVSIFAQHYGITATHAKKLIDSGRDAHARHCEHLADQATETETLAEIYTEYTPGSTGFCAAVQTQCDGYQLSDAEIERLAARCKTAAEFDAAWHSDTWWCDPGQS